MSRAAAVMMANYENPMRTCDSADFNTSQVLTRAGFSGAADSKKGILSAWVRLDGSNAIDISVVNGLDSAAGAEYFILRRQSTNKFRVLVGGSLSTAFEAFTLNTYTASGTWLHILSSWDVATVGARHLYVNDVSDISGITFSNITIDYTLSDWSVGANAGAGSGAARFDGCVAELYIAPGQYLDFSIPYNRRKFRSSSGKPVHLGATGQLPLGVDPLVYLHLDDGEAVANLSTNRGSGGNYAITGTLATGSTSPSD